MIHHRPVSISRHAIERYIERVEPVDELEAHSQIAGMLQRSGFFGRTGRVLKGSVSLVVDNCVVVTVLAKDQRPKHRTRRRTFELDGDDV